MEHYSLIVVSDETAPIRRYEIKKLWIKRGLWAAATAALFCLGGLVDYVRVRMDQPELERLRVETAEQRAQIQRFETVLSDVEGELARVREFERKVRIIANLPGAAAAGGEAVSRAEGSASDALEESEVAPALETEPLPPSEPAGAAHEPDPGLRSESAERVSVLRKDGERLGAVVADRSLSLSQLVEALEEKRHHLASMPAIWPAEGWLTSRFGYRTSPFTGKRQFHAGIDIAGERGTEVVAPARGVVKYAARKGPLGNTVILDHGYGIRTLFGHNAELHVTRGESVERGQPIATLGSSGRSTGPHLHYVVEVDGKSVNPLDYIFD